MSRRPPIQPTPVSTSHHSPHNNRDDPSSSSSPSRRFDPITTARRKFGAKVNLSALGPGNERVVASELLLIEAAGGPAVILDATRSSIPFPHEQLFQYQQKEVTKQIIDPYAQKPETKKEIVLIEQQREPTALDRAAWQLVAAYRNLWIESWEQSDRVRSVESRERKELYRLAAQSYQRADKMTRIQAVAWQLIEDVEEDVRERLQHERELVHEGLMHFFRGKRNEIEIAETLKRTW